MKLTSGYLCSYANTNQIFTRYNHKNTLINIYVNVLKIKSQYKNGWYYPNEIYLKKTTLLVRFILEFK